MPKLVALSHVRTRKVVQEAAPPGVPFNVTEEVSYLPSADETNPTVFEVESDEEAEALVAAGAARSESDHEEALRVQREAAERGPVPQVTQSAAPVGPGSGLTVAPDPNEVGARAATSRPTHELYGGPAPDVSKEPLEVRHSAPVDLASSSPESVSEGAEEQPRRGPGRPRRE
jgi:hypothetical protein